MGANATPHPSVGCSRDGFLALIRNKYNLYLLVETEAHPRQPRRLLAADGQYLNARLFGQVRGDMTKLAGEVLVDKQHLHTAAPCVYLFGSMPAPGYAFVRLTQATVRCLALA